MVGQTELAVRMEGWFGWLCDQWWLAVETLLLGRVHSICHQIGRVNAVNAVQTAAIN